MNELQQDNRTKLNLNRTIRDDISLSAMHAAIFVSDHKANIKERSFAIDVDSKEEGDGARLTTEFVESFIDAMARVYGFNVEKINNYSFNVTYAVTDNSMPNTAWELTRFCMERAAECGIPNRNVAFGDATATNIEGEGNAIRLVCYIAPFRLHSNSSIQISSLNKIRLFLKEVYRIIRSK